MTSITVIKCGGNATVAPEAICADVARLHSAGTPVILVHGGSADIDDLCGRLGVARHELVAPDGVSTRHTDAATLEVVTLALAGAVKPRLLTMLAGLGVRAVGLTGLDGGLLRARRKSAHRAVVDGRTVLIRDNHSGTVSDVDSALLGSLLDAGVVPVVSPPALASDGGVVNVDADRAAAAVAGAVGADTMLMLTGAPGVLADPADESSVLTECHVPAQGPPPFTGGGMGMKLVAAREAVRAGVPRVLVADGRTAAPVSAALDGSATRVVVDHELAAVAT